MSPGHRVSSRKVDELVEGVLVAVDGETTGDAAVATLVATSRLLQGEKEWAVEVKFVQDMLDYASVLIKTEGKMN